MKSEWVSVEERNPVETGVYLVTSRIGSISPEIKVSTLRGMMTEHHGFRWMEMDWQKVTHWMELPDPPGAGND